MQVIHTIRQLREVVQAFKQAGKKIAFVPTMGNLHEGHLQLVSMAQTKAEIVVCSIFVNPLQFGEGEDFDKYPKTLKDDTRQLQQLGCDIVFAPSVEEMYPGSSVAGKAGATQSQIVVPGISDILEGASRPGHFTGVATVVGKLFNMVQPDLAVFGEKDYQQLLVIKRFVNELCFPVDILSHPIVREENGLAMSSRNGYLSTGQKQQASALYRTLQAMAQKLQSGSRDYQLLEQEAVEQLQQSGFKPDYIQIRNTDLSKPTLDSKQLVILAAAWLGNTRLIDNIQLSL